MFVQILIINFAFILFERFVQDDNIWMFALGLFLVEITPESLQFTATYGLAAGCAVLLFGSFVGDWIDNTPRLTGM